MVIDDIIIDGGPRLVPSAGCGAVTLTKVTAADLRDLPATTGVRADGAPDADERYRLTVTAEAVEISAVTAEGAFRGLTTLRQLITASTEGRLPGVEILDGPRFAWRGLSLDVARTFHAVPEVKRVIDMLSLHKLNVLHLHLTDDQGWRFEVPGWPRLHELSDQGTPGDRPGGHYTDADIADLVAYGRARHVTLVPEADLPGHVGAAVGAYPELAGAAGGPAAVLAVGTPRTTEFLQAVIASETRLFPDAAFLHIGADEAFGMAHEAYSHYVEEVSQLVAQAGRRVLGWQEHARARTDANSVAQQWIHPGMFPFEDLSADAIGLPADMLDLLMEHFTASAGDMDSALSHGATLLLSPASLLYFDRPSAESSIDPEQEQRRTRLGMPVYPPLSLSDIVTQDPVATVPLTNGVESVAGVEGAVWCETVTDAADLELLLLPRLAGLSEVSWGATRAWGDHAAALADQAPAWDRRGWGYLKAAGIAWGRQR